MPPQSLNFIRAFADNQDLFDEVKTLFINEFSKREVNELMTDDALGQVTRAQLMGLRKVEEVFREIARQKTVKDKEEEKNPAR